MPVDSAQNCFIPQRSGRLTLYTQFGTQIDSKMNPINAIKIFCVMLSVLLVSSYVSSAPPTYPDYDNNVRDLLEYLMQREAGIEDRLGLHQVVRKAGRSPQLRLRFGKRSDNGFPISAYINEPEQQ